MNDKDKMYRELASLIKVVKFILIGFILVAIFGTILMILLSVCTPLIYPSCGNT